MYTEICINHLGTSVLKYLKIKDYYYYYYYYQS